MLTTCTSLFSPDHCWHHSSRTYRTLDPRPHLHPRHLHFVRLAASSSSRPVCCARTGNHWSRSRLPIAACHPDSGTRSFESTKTSASPCIHWPVRPIVHCPMLVSNSPAMRTARRRRQIWRHHSNSLLLWLSLCLRWLQLLALLSLCRKLKCALHFHSIAVRPAVLRCTKLSACVARRSRRLQCSKRWERQVPSSCLVFDGAASWHECGSRSLVHWRRNTFSLFVPHWPRCAGDVGSDWRLATFCALQRSRTSADWPKSTHTCPRL